MWLPAAEDVGSGQTEPIMSSVFIALKLFSAVLAEAGVILMVVFSASWAGLSIDFGRFFHGLVDFNSHNSAGYSNDSIAHEHDYRG